MQRPNIDISQIKVLIVDDEKYNVMLVKNLIKDMGVNIFTCYNGREAIEHLKKNKVDVIITNIMMPELDGLQLISRIRKNISKDIYIIIITALEATPDKVKGLELGANDYITKPFNKPELRSRIRIGIREALLKRELIVSNCNLEKREKELSAALEEIKRNQSMLIQQQKMASLGILSAGIAHEINNPATFINVNATTMEKWCQLFKPIFDKALEVGLDQELGVEKLSDMMVKFPEMIQSIKEGVARISLITNALKSFAREEHEGKKLINIQQVFERVAIMTKNQYKYHADLVIEYETEIPKIFGNSQKLEQVFVNLIINAADATKEKADIMKKRDQAFQGDISIIASMRETAEKGLKIVVKDNGIGMENDVMGKIFDPFFTTKHMGKGTGLGMSIVYGIIQDHGGSISVESTKGEGTEFTITLPIQ